MKLIFILIFALALSYRMMGNQWGLVTGQNLLKAGYNLDAGYNPEWIVAGYVYDEERFVGSMGFLPELMEHLSNWWKKKENLGQSFISSVKALWPGGFMQMRPVGPYFFSTVAMAAAKTGNILGLNDMHHKTVKSIYYRINRALNAVISACTLWIILGLIGKSNLSHSYKWGGIFGALMFCFQPASVVHGHWVTYNSVLALIKLAELLYLNYICNHINSWTLLKYMLHMLALSLLIGGSIGAKFTGGAVLIVACGALLILGLKKTGRKEFLKRFWRNRYFSGQLMLILGAVLFFAISLSPMLLIDERPPISFQVEGAAYYSRLKVAAHYFLKTLPAGMGWPCYLLGLVGLASAAIQWKKLNLLKASLISLVFIMIYAFTSNSLGMQPQRSLTVYAAWVVFAVWGLEFLGRLKWPNISVLAGIYAVAGSVFASSLLNYNLIRDYPGYRSEASEYLLAHVPPGENIYIHTVTKHGQIDVSYYETLEKPEKPVYQYMALYTWQLDAMKSREGYALYPESWEGGERLATFHSSFKKESSLIRSLRILFGFHRADQIVDAPSFSIYRLES